MGDLLILLSDKHWEFWHRLNVFQLRELATLTGAYEDIKQAWKRRLLARMVSNDRVRVYELGGFLYEVHITRGGFIAKAIDVRQYAGLLDLVRPKCCSSLDYAQALTAAKARAGGKQSEFDDLEKVSAMSDDGIRKLGGIDWWVIAVLAKKRGKLLKGLAKERDELAKGLMAWTKAEGADEAKK